MVNLEQIRQTSVEERIQLIELILQSLKQDLQISPTNEKPKAKPFKVRTFSLGQEVHVDRDRIYLERII
jgi:hypothetical protein